MNDDEIIAEQRTQLMQLREQLKRSKLGITLLSAKHLAQGFKSQGPTTPGKTVGFKVSDGTRTRLEAQQKRIGAKTYRQTVQACLELGLRELERVPDAEQDSVEEVPVVQRADDQGDRGVRASATG